METAVILPCVTDIDDELLGVANRTDGMGVLAIWSARGRDLVPHLTEQTRSARAFQILVEALRLWGEYMRPGSKNTSTRSRHASRASDFFILVEQLFARSCAYQNKQWRLPGARRVRARMHDAQASMSVGDQSWHLLGGQKASGIWGLYRGAAGRAGFLNESLDGLSAETMAAVSAIETFPPRVEKKLLKRLERAMEGETVRIPLSPKSAIFQTVNKIYAELPHAQHLRKMLVDEPPLNSVLAKRLLKFKTDRFGRRALLATLATKKSEFGPPLERTIACENLLALIEPLFFWLCAHRGSSIKEAADALTIDLKLVEQAKVSFARSGPYPGGAASRRFKRIVLVLDTTTKTALLTSILQIHEEISRHRGRKAWVWVENGRLHCDLTIERPPNNAFEIGVAWRSDYYLDPLRLIARELAEVTE